MMSETRARASRLARWLGSLERNGFTGRRAPASPTAVDAPGGVIGGRGAGGVGGIEAVVAGCIGGGAGRAGGAPGVGGGVPATEPVNGRGAAGGIDVADGDDVVGAAGGLLDEPGTNGGADGPAPLGARAGVNPGVAGGELNSGIPPLGDGGVAVAVTGPDSDRWRGIAGDSTVLAGLGGGGAGVYGGAAGAVDWVEGCAGGVAVRGVAAAGVATPLGAGIVMTPLQTEHRARTPLGGTFAGSTRKIERQSGQLTFIHSLRSCEPRVSPALALAA